MTQFPSVHPRLVSARRAVHHADWLALLLCTSTGEQDVLIRQGRSWQEVCLGHELKAGANPRILLEVILVGVILGSVHQLEPSISKVRVELGMVGGVFSDDLVVGLVRNKRDIRGQAHGLGKLARVVAGVPLVIAIPESTQASQPCTRALQLTCIPKTCVRGTGTLPKAPYNALNPKP